MESSQETNGLTGINVRGIETELREIWENLAKEESHKGQVLMRACVLNLVAFATGDPGGQDTISALGEVISDHPSRLIILLPEADSPESSIRAAVTTQCHAAGSRRQVCCEQIVVSARGDGIRGLASAVRPLLVPDLPVVVYWRHEADFSPRVFSDLARTADRIIVDSRRFRDSAHGFQNLKSAIEVLPNASFSDLSWTRMNPWRRMVSGFFNIPDCRAWLNELSEVEIDCARSTHGQTGLPVQALLLSAWLSSRLGWDPRGHFEWISDESCRMELDAAGRHLSITVRILGSGDGLERIRLQSIQGASFNVSHDPGRKHLQSEVVVNSQTRNSRVTQLRVPTEAYVIARELEILGRDRVFEQAAHRAAELAN